MNSTIHKILVLYTGGTIGMDYTENGLVVKKGLFLSQLKSLITITNIMIDLIEYEELIDSSDISLSVWIKIINDIKNNYDDYAGFIIVHGTDTMAITASMLAFSLTGLNKPVVLTGAQLPLIHRRSDGWGNLIDSLYTAVQKDLKEVVIVFNHQLYRGCRAQKVSTNNFFGFDSVDEEPLADFGINIIWHKKRWLKHHKLEKFNPIIPKDVKVLELILRPGFTTEFISDTLNKTNAKAIVLQTYGSGTIPINNSSFVEALKNATKRGIIVVSVTQVIEGLVTNEYKNSKLDDIGVISGKDMTPEATLCKLWVLLSTNLTFEEIKEKIKKSIVGELTESRRD
jgi:L-asparaginase